jgi:hypothetical protein
MVFSPGLSPSLITFQVPQLAVKLAPQFPGLAPTNFVTCPVFTKLEHMHPSLSTN